jgi:hypothetical protein
MEREIRVYPPVFTKNLMIFLAYFKGRANHSSKFKISMKAAKKNLVRKKMFCC